MPKATIQIEVDEETAKGFLASIMEQIQSAVEEKRDLEERIFSLNERAQKIRSQIPGEGDKPRQPYGENAKLMTDYLRKIAGNKGDSVTGIAAATGVKLPSVYYTLQNNPNFTQDKDSKLWKLDL